jgi:uncharacterized protein (DUF1501 family)
MNRRKFLKNISLITGASTISFSIAGIPIKAFARPLLNIKSLNGKILVLLQFKGGNDGLNTIIPFEDSIYYNKRPAIGISKSTVVKINNLMGFHPSLEPLRTLYDEGIVSVIQNVGYANQNRSHFRSTDIWLSASDSNQYLYDGWAGRYLCEVFPDYPAVPPEYPMAIQLGSVQSLALESQFGGTGITFQDPNTFYQLVNGITADSDPSPNTLAGEELKFLKEVAANSIQYATVIKEKADAGQNKATYPNTNLAKQLAIIADLIAGGLQTQVYLATLDGFDTHSNQLTTHANLLKTFADAIKAFQEDLKLLGIADKVVTMTFSEFGRRLQQNGSSGTDHGAAAPMILIGNNVIGGFIGKNPNLSDLDYNGDIKYEFDFRQIYASLLVDHLGLPKQKLQDIFFKDIQTLSLIKNSPTSITDSNLPSTFILYQNYPNPFNPETVITYSLPANDFVRLKVYDILGNEITTIVSEYKSGGTYSVKFNGSNLSSGIYIYTLESSGYRDSKKMQLIK